MQNFYQSTLVKNLKLIPLLCFLFLGLASCQGNDSGDDTRDSNTPTSSTTTTQGDDMLTAPNITLSGNTGTDILTLFSIDSDPQIEGYEILYQVEIASDQEFASIVYNELIDVKEETASDGTSYFTPNFQDVTWPSLTTGDTYYLRVRRVAKKDGEEDIVGDYSDATEFSAPDLTCFIPVPQTTELDSNEDPHVLNFSLHTDSASCGTTSATIINSYEIQVASDQDFSNIEETGVLDRTPDLANLEDLSRSFSLTNALTDGTYYWRVRNRLTINADNIIVGPYSEAKELSVTAQ